MDSLVTWLVAHLGSAAGKKLTVFIISMIPIVELRGGLLAASPALLDVPILQAIPLCIIGNTIPVPIILLLITPFFNFLKKTERLRPTVEKFEQKAMGKSDKIQRYKFWGLVLFVGVPLPGTGAWTGSLIAALLNFEFKKAFAAIFLGICMATIIMSVISYGLLGAIVGGL